MLFILGAFMKFSFKELTKFERILWIVSLCVVSVSFILLKNFNYITLIASLIGVTALIFCARGHAIGQILIIIFALLYGYVSFEQKYYGEMITYIGMSAPIALVSVITWLRNPFEQSNEVKINKLRKLTYLVLFALTAAVTFVFYFILENLGTSSLLFSTLSVATSFLAASLTMLRSEYYALAYAANDVVLIILWSIASIEEIGCLPMIACFLMFLANDIYGYYSWKKRKIKQNSEK